MKKFLYLLTILIGSLVGISESQQNYNFNYGGLSYSSGATVPTSCSKDGSWYWLNTGTKAWYTCVGGTWQVSFNGASVATPIDASQFNEPTSTGAQDVCKQIQDAENFALLLGKGAAFEIVAPVNNKAYCSVVPQVANARGEVLFIGADTRAIIYTSISWTGLSSGITFKGTGPQGSTITNNIFNVQIKACNPNIHDNTYPVPNATNSAPCAAFYNSSTNTPQASVASITAAAGGTSTITLQAALSGTPPTIFAGRLLCIGKETASAANANCWMIKSEPTGGGTIFTVNTTSTVLCASTCGGLAFLDTPMFNMSSTTPNFFVQFKNMSFDCAYVYACAGGVNGGAQEGSKLENIQFYNATVYGFRVFIGNAGSPNAYGGNGGGSSHSGPYERVFFNYQSETCEIAAGCNGFDTTHAGPGFLEAAGTNMACGDRTVVAGGQAILAYSAASTLTPCQKTMVGIASDGLGSLLNSNSNAIYGFIGVTSSLKDVFNTGSHVIMPELTQGIGIFTTGPTQSFLGSHVEFSPVCHEIGGMATVNETWIEDGTTTSQGITYINGDSNNCTNQVFDIGSANGTTNVMNLSIENFSTTGAGAAKFVKNNVLAGEDCTNGSEKTLWYVFVQTATSVYANSDCTTATVIIPQALNNSPATFSDDGFCVGAVNAAAATYPLHPYQSNITNTGCATLVAGNGTGIRVPVTTAAGKCTIYANAGVAATNIVTITLNNLTAVTSLTTTIAAAATSGNVQNGTLAFTKNDAYNLTITVGATDAVTNLRVRFVCW